jgi:two-component system chemotaxis response regulator CheY
MQALVVDDSRAMRAILTRLMTGLGFDVVQAPDGAEALELLDGGLRPDVALMVTTESEQSQIARALAAGAHEYVIKPFTDEVITEKLTFLGLVAAA